MSGTKLETLARGSRSEKESKIMRRPQGVRTVMVSGTSRVEASGLRVRRWRAQRYADSYRFATIPRRPADGASSAIAACAGASAGAPAPGPGTESSRDAMVDSIRSSVYLDNTYWMWPRRYCFPKSSARWSVARRASNVTTATGEATCPRVDAGLVRRRTACT